MCESVFGLLCDSRCNHRDYTLVYFTQAESARPFYRQKFRVVLSFGMTEIKAEVKWFEGVRTSCSFRSIILTHRVFMGRAKKKGNGDLCPQPHLLTRCP